MVLAAAPPAWSWKRIVLYVAAISVIVVGALTILYFVGTGLGFGVFVAASAIALLPVPFLVAAFLALDRYDPAPIKYLAFAFGWGAFAATAISLGVNTGLAWVFHQVQIPGYLVAVLVAPVIEEITKALAVFMLFWFRRREVVGLADALMYAGLSATGFAMTENVLYLGNVYVSGERMGGALVGVGGVIGLVIMRLGLTGFIHPLFTAMTGIGIGFAARSGKTALRWLLPIAGLLAAMILHGSWNLMATFLERSKDLSILGYAYLLVALPLLFVAAGLLLRRPLLRGRS
jgi:RsiW-degrading membrane proteinase PrsW (M82 family)